MDSGYLDYSMLGGHQTHVLPSTETMLPPKTSESAPIEFLGTIYAPFSRPGSPLFRPSYGFMDTVGFFLGEDIDSHGLSNMCPYSGADLTKIA